MKPLSDDARWAAIRTLLRVEKLVEDVELGGVDDAGTLTRARHLLRSAIQALEL